MLSSDRLTRRLQGREWVRWAGLRHAVEPTLPRRDNDHSRRPPRLPGPLGPWCRGARSLGGRQGDGNDHSQDGIRVRVLKAGGLAPSRRFNANEIAAVAACPLPPAAALEGASRELWTRGALTSRSVAYASASERRATVYREDCATPSPLRANCAKRLQQSKQAVWAFGRIM